MPAVATVEQLLETVRKSGLVEETALANYVDAARAAGNLPETPQLLARAMIRDSLLTHFQAGQLLAGKTRGFVLNGKYKLLEHLGAGGMGTVYLCEHTSMRRRVAIKVLPVSKAQDPSYLERFYREARAVAALDHPNIVRAHDIDHDDKLHFLVMEYVDGSSLQEIVARHGPLDVTRAAHYMAQAALGLEHAHEAGLVHRDIKPGNILVDRSGSVKVLDMGLARFFHDDDNLSKKYDETVLGTSDYLAPEQTLDSNVDIRADIYSLGATFYFCLTGQTLFGEGTAAQKLIWHQTRQPKPIRSIRPEVPEEMARLIEEKMLAKEAAQRFQTPGEIADALVPWTAEPIPPPPEDEMPKLSPAASRFGSADGSAGTPGSAGPSSSPSGAKRSWTVSGAGSPRPKRGPITSRRPGGSAPQLPPAPSTRIAADTNAVPEAGATSGVGRANGQRAAAAIQEMPTAPPSSRKARPRAAPANGDDAAPRADGTKKLILVAAAAVLGVLLIAGTSAGVWWLFLSPPRPTPARPGPVAGGAAVPAPGVAPAAQTAPAVAPAVPAEGVSIQLDRGAHRIHAPKYDATVEGDGCLTSLRLGGTEFLWAGGQTSRGSYFFQNGTLKVPAVEQESANVLTARGDRASVRYEFGADGMAWTVTNATDAKMSFFLVFDPAVKVVTNDRGEWARTPVTRDWPTTTWFAGPARLAITGANRLWGPFDTNHQVWEASLGAHETRRLTLQPGTASADEAKQVAAYGWEKRVTTPAYDATVEGDGCLTSLRVGGEELLWVGPKTSRGVYFYRQGKGTLHLPKVEEAGPNVVTAKNDQVSIRYEFGQDGMTWTLSNQTDDGIAFYMVFSPNVKAVSNDKGEWATTPAKREWPTTTWFTDNSKLTVKGGKNIWGPWGEDAGQAFQVWDGSLGPRQTREISLKVGAISPAEVGKLASVTGTRPSVETDLTLQAPLDYQVFQRYSRNRGQITLQGKVKPACDTLQVRLTGESREGKLPGKWQNLVFDKGSRTFDTTLPAPAGGWYKLEVQALQEKKVVAEAVVDHVGIGEVFVIAGQSNSTNCGEEQLKTQTGMVSSFSGTSWQPADDPQPGVHDKTGSGSPWPAFGDALYEKYHVPIGIASTGHTGSSVRAWQPGSAYFNHMMMHIRRLGTEGFRAVLWHQGESDVGMTSDDYAQQLTNVIEASKKEAGWDFPWVVAQVSYHDPEHPSYPSTREAQKKLWETKVAVEGPDTDALTGDNRDNGGKGIHFSGKGLRAHGKLWAEKVSAYIDKVLAE
jgi:serine/threonine protein kinase